MSLTVLEDSTRKIPSRFLCGIKQHPFEVSTDSTCTYDHSSPFCFYCFVGCDQSAPAPSNKHTEPEGKSLNRYTAKRSTIFGAKAIRFVDGGTLKNFRDNTEARKEANDQNCGNTLSQNAKHNIGPLCPQSSNELYYRALLTCDDIYAASSSTWE